MTVVVGVEDEPPLGTPVGGYPAATMHTSSEERTTAESALRDTVSDELGDQAGQTDLHVSAGLIGHVIVEAARQTHAQLMCWLPARANPCCQERPASTSSSKPSAP